MCRFDSFAHAQSRRKINQNKILLTAFTQKKIMTKRIYLFITILQWFAVNSFAQHTDTLKSLTYKNPLPVAFGDPYVLQDSVTYYMYGTGGGAKNGFASYSSTDLVNWKFEGQVYYGNNENGWGTGDYWAPEVFKRNGKYYMFYSAQWKDNPTNELENFRIGVAVADKPTGPFVDLNKAPVFDPGYPIIDADILFDEDGKAYLYYSR